MLPNKYAPTAMALSLVVLCPTVLAAADWQTAMTSSDWDGSIGAGAFYAPDYLGSDDYKTRGLPNLNLSYGDRFYLNIRDGLGWNFINRDSWSLSTFIGYVDGRDNEDDLSDLDKVEGGAAIGLRLALEDGPFKYSASVKTPFTGDVDGYQLTLKGSWRTPLTENLFLSAGPGLTYSSERWTESMFGISESESARSGLTAYDVDNGYLRVRFGGAMTYSLSADWSLTGLAGVAYLTGEAKDSPIVADIGDPVQGFGGLLMNYRF
ncbi:MipA/OmpV family protein [Marinobacter sp. ATCH36]|uniref:MipA/OmpV family protein n=1 Tax=Marinobacter sp. ATCH36 TaxID=2945106 RepID=UPI002020FD91|nr:MipA/OmpV family protein [Marinobacter sp. ATCH36]MCL7944034.1 MipA/OmpV family protein [Marinobacter sp. ATCH36]